MVKSESDIIDTIHTGQVITDRERHAVFCMWETTVSKSPSISPLEGSPLDDLIVDVVRHTAAKAASS